MLPKLNAPTYSLELPSTGEQIKFRPFLVKEQKILLIAQESGEQTQLMDAMNRVIRSCTFNKIDPLTAPMFDVEYIFLKLRAKSVGEAVDIKLLCPDDNETYANAKVNLDEVEISVDDDHSNTIQLTDKIKVVMKYPQLSDMRGLTSADLGEAELAFDVLKRCIWEVHEGDTVYHRVDLKTKDIDDFVDSFDVSQLENMMGFFNTMPRLAHTVKVTNPKTKVESDVTIQGIDSFLA